MIQLGRYNTLVANCLEEHGFYFFDPDSDQEVLVPNRYVKPEWKPGEEVRLFVYTDSEDRPVATTETPLATVGQVASLRVVELSRHGAFLDWGLAKDLFVPFREQKLPMEVGRHYLVYLYEDTLTRRVAASSKIDKFIHNDDVRLHDGDKVEIHVYHPTQLGFKVVVDHLHFGLVYRDQAHKPLTVGQRLEAYVLSVRPDGNIDISLEPLGYRARIGSLEETLLKAIDKNGGNLPLNDKSDPEAIRHILGMSKKSFKMAAGALYKQGVISIGPEGLVRLK